MIIVLSMLICEKIGFLSEVNSVLVPCLVSGEPCLHLAHVKFDESMGKKNSHVLSI
jgi:hypothetical protein